MSSFFLQQHGAKLNPLIVAANAVPKYLLWAEDLASGTVTSWQARFNSASATLTGGVVRSDTGYNQRKALFLDGGDYVNLDSILGSFQAGQERTVFLAVRLNAEASVRCLMSDSQSTGSTSTMVKISLDASDFGTVTKSAAVSSPTTQIPEGVPLILVFRSNGNTIEVFQRKRGVDTTILTETLTETVNVHDQHTLFAHRFQSTVTQYTTGYLRLALEFGIPLQNTNVTAVLNLLEESIANKGYDCPTVEEPEVLLQNELGAAPHILLYGPDLTIGSTPTTLPNRGTGPDATSVAYPTVRAPVVSSYNNIPTVRFRGNGYADFSSSIDGPWGGYDTAEVILIAVQYGSTVLNNMRFIDYESTAINGTIPPQRVIEAFNSNFRNYHVIGTGSTQEVATANTPVKHEARFCIAYSKDGSGNARMLVRSRTQTGGFNEVYVTGTQATSVATAMTGAFVGGVNRPSSSGQVAFDIGDLAFISVTRNVSVANQAGLTSLIDLMESENGLNLAMGRKINQLNSAPQSSSMVVWYSGRLQTTAITTAVDDWSPAGADGTPTGMAIATDRFDYGSVATNFIQPNPAIAIPTGTGSLACMAIVSRKSGLSWTSADSYNIASGNNVGSCAFYVTAGNLKVLWNSTALDSGYSVLGWTVGVDHTVAFDYDGTTIRFFVDNMTTPVGTVVPGVARANLRTLQIGAFNNSVGWQGHMRSIQYWLGANLTTAGDPQKAAVSQWMQLLRIRVEGDSNSDANVSVAPAGAAAWWYQIKDLFATEGWTADFTLNNAVSGSTWNNATPIAPTPMIARGTTLDGTITLGAVNVLIVGSHSTNDFNYSGLSLATVQGHITTYCNARKAAGWSKIFFVETIPQSRNPTLNTRVNDLNTWLLTQVGTLFEGLIQLPAALKDSTDTTYFFPNSSPSIAEHYNATGNGLLSATIVSFLKSYKWS